MANEGSDVYFANLMSIALPKPLEFSEAGRLYLDGFYRGHDADTTAKRIDAIRKHILKEEMLVTSTEGTNTDESELRALEYYVLIDAGFDE